MIQADIILTEKIVSINKYGTKGKEKEDTTKNENILATIQDTQELPLKK